MKTFIVLELEGDATLLKAAISGSDLKMVNAMLGAYIRNVKITRVTIDDGMSDTVQSNGNSDKTLPV
jgi:hypothetical protein